MYLQVPSRSRTPRLSPPNWRRNSVSSQIRCSLSLGLLLVPAHHQNQFPATRRTKNHQSSPEWKDPFQHPPSPGGGVQKDGEKLSQVLCETFQRATFHARKKILSTEPALQVQRTRTDNF